jgi:hypothetical protein
VSWRSSGVSRRTSYRRQSIAPWQTSTPTSLLHPKPLVLTARRFASARVLPAGVQSSVKRTMADSREVSVQVLDA